MNIENKNLLINTLCTGLNYNIKAHYEYYDFMGGVEKLVEEGDGVIKGINLTLGNPIEINNKHCEIEYVKPYLRPMSSMTEKERCKLRSELSKEIEKTELNISDEITNGFIKGIAISSWTVISYCLKKYLDINNLIEKGMALIAPEGMYKID